MKFEIEKAKDNLRIIHKTYSSKHNGNGNDISGPFWMLIRTDVITGKLKWKVNTNFIVPNKNPIWLYIPPYSWTCEFYDSGTEVSLAGIIGVGKEPKGAPSLPSIFDFSGKFPRSRKDIDTIFKRARLKDEITICTNPSGTALKIKTLIDANFRVGISMSEIAKRLNTSQAVCSRQFKRTFGFTPGYYKRGLKVTVGAYSLLTGLSPLKAADAAGYNDLSRFYKQFSQYMKMTPDQHREKSKNAKTKKSVPVKNSHSKGEK